MFIHFLDLCTSDSEFFSNMVVDAAYAIKTADGKGGFRYVNLSPAAETSISFFLKDQKKIKKSKITLLSYRTFLQKYMDLFDLREKIQALVMIRNIMATLPSRDIYEPMPTSAIEVSAVGEWCVNEFF